MPGRWGFSFALAAGPLLAACRTPTQISVTVQSDVCSEVTRTSFTSGELGAVEGASPTSESLGCRAGHIGTIVLIPSGADDAEVGFKVVTALNGETIDTCASAAAASDSNCIVARRDLRFLPHERLDVIVDMAQECAGFLCDARTTCVNEVCVGATIDDPSSCEGAGCGDQALGPATGDGGLDATVGDASAPGAEGGVTLDAGGDGGDGGDAGTTAPIDGGPRLDAAPCDLGGLQAGAAWPMGGYCPNRRGRSPLAGPANAVLKWHIDIAGHAGTGPSIGADGTVYLGTIGVDPGDGGPLQGGALQAIDPDGGVAWTYAPPGGASFDQVPVIAADSTLRLWDYQAGIYDVLALDGGVVTSRTSQIEARGGITIVTGGGMYLADNDGDLFALNPAGGTLWESQGTATDFSEPVVGADGTIFLSDQHAAAHALFPDGGLRWSKAPVANPGLLGNVEIAPDGTLRTFASSTNELYAIDPTSGSVDWSKTIDVPNATVQGFAIADDGTTYVGSQNVLAAFHLDGSDAGAVPLDQAGLPTIDVNGDVYLPCRDVNDIPSLCSYDHALDVPARWQVNISSSSSFNEDLVVAPVIGPGQIVYLVATDSATSTTLYAFGPP